MNELLAIVDRLAREKPYADNELKKHGIATDDKRGPFLLIARIIREMLGYPPGPSTSDEIPTVPNTPSSKSSQKFKLIRGGRYTVLNPEDDDKNNKS